MGPGEAGLAVALPDDEYLLRLGKVAYAVSYVEWTVLGDLYGLRDRLPANLTVQHLAGKTTGSIAKALRDALPEIADPEVHEFIEASAEVLADLSTRRNQVLHARPATTEDGRQRLLRYRPLPDGLEEMFWIDDQFLDDLMATITVGERRMGTLRPHPERECRG